MSPLIPPEGKFSFTFEGRMIDAYPGQSVAAAILSQGEGILRQTRNSEKPRGVFCGIGICFDCLVVVDGIPNQRSCLLEAHPDLRVEIQHGSGIFSHPVTDLR